MKSVNKSVLIWYSRRDVCLGAGCGALPRVLPWCSHSQVLEESEQGMTAEIGMSMAGLRKSFVTRNAYEDHHKINMRLVKGPFSKLEGNWLFHPVGDGSQRACKVELQLVYGYDSVAAGTW